ncbi:MAG: DUF5060 domain-containing protein, partial [Kiritimatiellae bacterium]|nr:DUF5060 domain-containing protein [Kiritimatiellia bacterium]
NKIPVGINRVKYAWNFYNPGSPIEVALGVRGLTNNYLCMSLPQTVTAGWNRITYDLSAGTWACADFGGGHQWNLLQITNAATGQGILEDVREVSLLLTNLAAGSGSVYVDNVTIRRDDGFVIYAEDPVVDTIRAHADRMTAKNTATNRPGNHVPAASSFVIFADDKKITPVNITASDADGDPLSYRVLRRPEHGWVFGSPPTNLAYKPMLGHTGSDYFTYVAHDGARDSAEATVTVMRISFDHIRYDFEQDEQGWYANYTPWCGYAVTSVLQTTAIALHGAGSLRANVDIYGTAPHDAGDAEVNLEADPPPFLQGPVDLENQPLTISVYCPAGARGSEINPNRLQIYAKDTNWLAEYTMETDIVEGEWVTYTLIVSTSTPPGGWKADGFNPRAIRALGARIKFGGSGSEYQGPIYLDAVCFPAIGDCIYSFDTSAQDWQAEDWGFGSVTITWSDEMGNPRAGGIWVEPTYQPTYSKYYIKDGEQVENQNIYYKPVVRAYVWVSDDCSDNIHDVPRLAIHLRSRQDGWTYDNHSDLVALTPGQWNLIEWDASGVNAVVLQHVDEWGFEIEWPDQYACRTPIFIDSIHVAAKNPQAAPAITSIAAASNTVGKYERFELDVGLANVGGLNPYNPHLVDLRAAFTSPSGRVWNVNGFYMEDEGDAYGDGDWQIRFAPGETGTWSYRVMVGNELGGDTSTVSTFTCVPSDRHGWVRVSDDDPHYLEHDDDSPFIGIGYCHCWDGDDEGIFSECEKYGINMIHWWMAAWDTLLTVKPADPGDTWRESSSYDTYEQGRAVELDRVVGHAEKHGVKLVFTIWPHDSIRDFNHHKWRINGSWQKAFDQKFSEPEWYVNAFSELDNPPMNQKFFYDPEYREYQDRLYRYIIARWGYSEAIGTWALASELFGTYANSANCIDYQGKWATNKAAAFGENPYLNMDMDQCDGNDYTIPWLEYIHGYFRDNDPFGHPTTASYGTDEYWAEGFPVVDIPQIHTYADLYSWITPPNTVARYHHYLRDEYNKPSFMGEIGTVEWKLFEPDYVRVTAWPGICSGGAITPMMWTTPAFSWFGDAKMGPWLESMSEEMKILARFTADIPFHRAALVPAPAATKLPGEPDPTLVESFESGMNSWHTWGNGIAGSTLTADHATHDSQCLRLDIDMDTYAHMPEPASGIEKYEGDGFAYDWSDYWPRGHLRMNVFVPEFYHPEHNTNGFLLGINKDPRSILEIFTRDESGQWHWYSTTNEYGGPGRESGGWKKMTVGMLWNLELPLDVIPTEYEASHIVGFKFWFGDVGILRGPIYIDNLTAGLYPFNTYAMVSTNRTFAFGWIQDRRWDDAVVQSNATFEIADMMPGNYHIEWWSTLSGITATYNLEVSAKGTLSAPLPPFTKDIAVKVRRIGDVGATVHNVAVGGVQDFKWLVQSPYQKIDVQVINRGSAAETFSVTLADLTDSRVIGTQTVSLAAGALTHAAFTWCSTSATVDVVHTLQATAAAVPGETDLADNTAGVDIMLYPDVPPWDSCDRLRRWAVDSNDSDGRRLAVSTNYWTERGTSFEFYHRSPSKCQAYFGFDQVYEDWSDRTAFMFDLYVADGSTNCEIMMRTGSDWVWHYSAPHAITSGWNRNILFDFTRASWTRVAWNDATQSNDCFHDVQVDGLDEIQQIFIKVSGYSDEGVVYVDNMRVPGYYTVHLAYTNGVDSFPRVAAEQSNYTAAASCWMIARYLNGPTFTQTQQQIYNATAHNPAHNNEITPASCANWMVANIVPGYYFDDRYQTSVNMAVREAVYWMDYVPPGGLKTPVYLVCGTNWSYKVMRGFQTDRKPYGGGGWGPWLDTNVYTVFGVWLNDPALQGLGYDVYAAAAEVQNIYQPSYDNGQYWMIAEPPEDAGEMSAALERIENACIRLAPPEPNADVAAFLAARFADAMLGPRVQGFGETDEGGDPDLLAVLPWALKYDEGFMTAFDAGQVLSWYAVNPGRADKYYLASGGEQGPASTRYIVKLAPDGAFLQATWVGAPIFYQPLPQSTAEWAARRQFGEGDVVTTESAELVSQAGASPFTPWWEFQLNVNGTGVFTIVRQDVDLNGDADGDGMSDGKELYAGFDPDDGLSVFSVEGGA